MTSYRVVWQLDVEAASPEEAAKEAMAAMPGPRSDSEATYFEVFSPSGEITSVDLLDSFSPAAVEKVAPPQVVIVLDGGIVQNVIASTPMQYLVADHDTCGADEDEMYSFLEEGRRVYVIGSRGDCQVSHQRVIAISDGYNESAERSLDL